MSHGGASGLQELCGWENDLDSIWLRVINNCLLKKGIITKEEHKKMQILIAKDGLNLSILRGNMTT